MADIRKIILKNGSVSYKVRRQVGKLPDGTPKYSYKSFSRRKDAQEYIESLSGISKESKPGLPVNSAIDKWLVTCETTGRDGREPVEKTTLDGYKHRANVMKSYCWDKGFDELERKDVKDFRQWLLTNKSRDLARKTLSSFHSVILEMREQEYIKEDIASGISISSGGRYDDKEVEIPSDKEMRDLLGAADCLYSSKNEYMTKTWSRYRPLIYLATFTGMRPSEYRGLPRKNFETDHVKIRQRADKYGTIGPTKSKAGRRDIFIPSAISDMVSEWIEKTHRHGFELLFPTMTNNVMTLNNLRESAWVPLMKEADLTVKKEINGKMKDVPKYSMYSLRHYFASKLIQKGFDLKAIQKTMGHSQLQITIDTYGHLMKDMEVERKLMVEELASEIIA